MGAFPYSFEVLDVDRLFVDSAYQRPLTSFSHKIEANFDPALVGTLVVSERTEGDLAGYYAIVDGQTRAAAIASLAQRDEARCTVPCLVYRGLTQADEARLFARLQKERRGVSSYHRFRADLVAGEPEAVAIEAIATRVGYEIGEGSNANGKLSAVAALENVHRRGPDILQRTLTISRQAWGADFIPPGDFLRGLGLVLKRRDIDDDRMAKRLATVTVESISRRASALREGIGRGGSSSGFLADAIEATYGARPAAAG